MKYKIIISFEEEFEDYDSAKEYAYNMAYDEDHNKSLDIEIRESQNS